MPQDDVEEVREALLGARHANENPVFYRMQCSFIMQFCSTFVHLSFYFTNVYVNLIPNSIFICIVN